MFSLGKVVSPQQLNQEYHITAIPTPTPIAFPTVVVSPTPVINDFMNNIDASAVISFTVVTIILLAIISILIFGKGRRKTLISLNTVQKIIWTIYLGIIFISIAIRLSGGDLWSIFYPGNCYISGYSLSLPWDCFAQRDINIGILLLVPAILLHFFWRTKSK